MSLDIVIFRPSWQVMRVSCLVEYNPYGGLLTVTGADDSLNRLNNYINAKDETVTAEIIRMQSNEEEEHACRIYRVLNFLQATINGLRGQNLPHLQTLQDFTTALTPQLNNSLVVKAANKWDWDVVYSEAEDMWIKERSWFMAILNDMIERIKEKHNDSAELKQFYNILVKINR